MTINLSEEEYRLLLDMTYIAGWVMHAYSDADVEESDDHVMLKQKLLACGEEAGVEGVLEYSPEEETYHEHPNYDERIYTEFIEPYDSNMFWEELAFKLAARDLVMAIGLEQYESMDSVEQVLQIEEIKEGYIEAFDKNGIKDVHLVTTKVKDGKSKLRKK